MAEAEFDGEDFAKKVNALLDEEDEEDFDSLFHEDEEDDDYLFDEEEW